MTRGPLTDETVTFGDTEFTIQRMMPLEAFRTFEAIRPGLASISDIVRSAFEAEHKGMDRNANMVGTAIEVIGKLDADIVEIGMKRLMQHVLFLRQGMTTGGPPTPIKVSSDMETAFMGMTVFQIYELLARAFAVNFTESFADLRSAWDKVSSDEADTETP